MLPKNLSGDLKCIFSFLTFPQAAGDPAENLTGFTSEQSVEKLGLNQLLRFFFFFVVVVVYDLCFSNELSNFLILRAQLV